MISNKHLTKITLILISIVLALCIAAMAFYDVLIPYIDDSGYSMEYETELFGNGKIIEVDILMDDVTRQEMFDNASQEIYYKCDVVVNGKTFTNVGVRPKGNTSLSSIARDPENNRYSFKLEFDKFVDGQTCFGLDKLILNNNYADATNMKEAIIYDMFQFLGADASLTSYANISFCGEYFGNYLALEAVEDSFMLRNYGTKNGYLYKPDNMDRNPRDETNSSKDSNNRGAGGFGGFGKGGGSNLNYTDSNLDSYGSIWAGAVTNSDTKDHKRVVTALKNISSATSIEQYMDVDNLLKYMAVHNFSVNEDSLSGMMAHNYYLYESEGKLNIIPWDYNLALGGMNGGNATSIINDPIDDSYSSTTFFNCLLKNEEYLEKYHSYYQKLVDEYFHSGKFEEKFTGIRDLIDDYVKIDPNTMYNYDAYVEATDVLYQLIKLRAESVKKQLDGEIPTTSADRNNTTASLVDGSRINISAMGSFMGGGRGNAGNFGGFSGNRASNSAGKEQTNTKPANNLPASDAVTQEEKQ